ncbi:MAG: choice-of-anchor T family protein [Thermoplasmatota archaeon]
MVHGKVLLTVQLIFAMLAVVMVSSSYSVIGISENHPIETDPNAVQDPEITITIDEDIYHVNVEPGSDGIVHASGTVTCVLPPGTPPGQYCVFSMQADAGGWPVSAPPPMAFDRNHQEERFTVEVQVPPTTSHMTQGQLSIAGRWTYSPGATGGTVPPIYSIIHVDAYALIELTCEDPSKSANLGRSIKFEITVKNEGNSHDVVSIELIDVPDQIDAVPSSEIMNIPEKSEEILIIEVSQPSGIGQKHTFIVMASSDLPGDNNAAIFHIYFRSFGVGNSVISNPYIILSAILIILAVIAAVVIIIVKRKRKSQPTEAV